MSKYDDYFQEAFEEALYCMGLGNIVDSMTPEQRAEVGKSISISYDNIGLAFYSPPSSDTYDRIDREWKAKFDALQREFDAYRNNSESAVKSALRLRSDANVSIGEHGSVTQWGGRSERIL